MKRSLSNEWITDDPSVWTEVIYKGATRPAMLLGMPMAPALGVSVLTFVPAVWIGYATGNWLWVVGALVVLAMVLLFMRHASIKDDQRVYHWLRWLVLTVRHRNSGIWGCHSYSPVTYKGASDDWIRC